MGADARPPVVFLMGPTASGKSDLALALARELPVEIVSVDSGMVYRGLDIGTAKPPPAARSQVPHHLIDVCDAADRYSAGRFRDDAALAIEAIHGRGALPLLVGGTGLYFRSLEQGITELPPADPAVRRALLAEADAKGWAALHRRLREVDPVAAARIHPRDPQRIQRALEVFTVTGRPLSRLFATAPRQPMPFRVVKLAVAPTDRADLHRRIEARFQGMLDAGLVDEVRGLYRRGDLDASLPAMRLVGYRQVGQFLEGGLPWAEMRRRGIVATRQLAKRQMTWLRAETGLERFDSTTRDLAANVLKFLQQTVNLRAECNILSGKAAGAGGPGARDADNN